MDEIKVDEQELVKQMKNEYLKGEGYIRLEIIAKENEEMPYCGLDCNGATPYEMMQLLVIMDEMKNIIFEKYPETKEYKNVVRGRAVGTIEMKREEK